MGGGATQDGRTPLFIAAKQGSLELVQLLLDAGANTEAKDTVRGVAGVRRFGCWWCSVHERSCQLNSAVTADGGVGEP